MAQVNKIIGNRFEARFTSILGNNGFWAHNFQQNAAGQPVDIIACRAGKAYLIDCKNCENGIFRFDRIETNQYYAMRTFSDRFGRTDTNWFALLYDGEIYMLSLADVMAKKQKQSGIKAGDCIPLKRWIENA